VCVCVSSARDAIKDEMYRPELDSVALGDRLPAGTNGREKGEKMRNNEGGGAEKRCKRKGDKVARQKKCEFKVKCYLE